MRGGIFISAAFFLAACAQAGGLPAPETSPFPKTTPINAAQSCGGMVASQGCTGANEYCHRDIRDICGAADAPGTCRVKPQMCTMDYTPVCGCDGKTYPNECAANSKGISAAAQGECN